MNREDGQQNVKAGLWIAFSIQCLQQSIIRPILIIDSLN